jgi:hypothetical protein
MDTTERPHSRRALAAGLVGAGVVGGVVLAGFHTASAQTDPTPAPSTGSAAPTAPDGAPPGGPGGRGPGGPHGGGMGIHGEFVTRAPNGGYQTMATQAGEVTAVSATSVTVKSEDGYSRTYTVNDGTLVNAGNDGIADVKTGDDVRVMATVAAGKATAVEVNDGTNIKASRDRWAPPPPAGSGTTSGTSSGTSSAT